MKKIYILALLSFTHFFLSAQTEFITTWKTDNPGVSNDNQITIPTFPGETYDYTVDWGDGTSDTNVIGDITHTYAAPGTYQIGISGSFPRIYFNYDGFESNIGDKDKILSVNQWGTVQWTSMENAFNGCTNLDVLATDVPNLSNVVSTAGMFYLCSALTGNSQFNNWQTGNVTDFLAMFRGATLFNQDLSAWDVSSATNLALMFSDAINFNQPIGNWNVSNVTNMDSMFRSALAFDQNLNNWDVSSVIQMSNMFNQAFAFNQSLSLWDVGSVVDMQAMFAGAIAFDQDISGWNVGNVSNMSEMFFDAVIFNQDIGNWDVSNVTQMFSMFEGAMDFDQNLGNWDISMVTTMENMFTDNALSTDNYDNTLIGWYQLPSLQSNVVFDGGFSQYCNSVLERLKLMYEKGWVINDEGKTAGFCAERPFITTWKTDNPGVSADNQISIPTFSGQTYDYIVDWGDGTSDSNVIGDITHTYSNAGTYQVSITGVFPRIYFEATIGVENGNFVATGLDDNNKLISIDQWGSNNWTSMESAFFGCENLKLLVEDIPDLSAVNSTSGMFRFCKSLTANPAMKIWDVSSVITMGGMFDNASSFNGDIGNWDVSSVTSMSFLFSGAETFNQNIGGWNVSNVIDMQYMFQSAKAFNQDISSWNMQSLQHMNGMFNGANSFNQSVDIWNVSNVISMGNVFSGATSFDQPIGSWDVSNVEVMGAMFQGATSFNQDISAWDVSGVTDMKFMFNTATAFNKDLDSWDTSNVTNMNRMFYKASAFNGQIGSWNVSSVNNMSNMFTEARAFNQDISNWDVSNVINMAYMFENATSFNGDISAWNVSNVQLMGNMFNGVANFNQDISGWDVSKVTEMTGMLAGATAFDQDLGNWDVSNVTDMTSMLFDVTLSTANYDSLLKGWSNLPSLQSNVVLDVGNSQYCSASAERQSIIDNYGWTITDAGNTDACYFITTWKTDNPGATSDDRIRIPTHPDETYDYDIDWGDGTMDSGVTGNITHQYAVPGTYTVKIIGNFPRIYFNNVVLGIPAEGDEKKLLSVDQWGTIRWRSMLGAFAGCSELDILATDVPNLNNVTDVTGMFRFCESLIGNESFSDWQVGTVNYFSNMFDGAVEFNQDIGAWDVSNAIYLSYMFSNAVKFNSDISNWDVSNAQYLDAMFIGAEAFNQPLGNWDVRNVSSMLALFGGAISFDQDISSWDVSNVQNMGAMFSGASSFNQDISNWNVGNVTNMNVMFFGTESFNQPLDDWNVSSVADMGAMFEEATSFNQPLNNWNVSNVTNMSTMFANATSFNQPLRNWDVSQVTDMPGMFRGASVFNQDLSNWNMSNVTSIGGMFNNAISYDQSLGDWDVSNVTSMEFLFNAAGLSTENYDMTLLGWSSLPSLQNDVVLNAGNSQYCESADARQLIIDIYGWIISDSGESPLCNQDNDVDGVLDHKDACLDTRPGVEVNANGCDVVPFDAIKVYVLTPSCVGSSDGVIEIFMDTSGYLLDISVQGDSYANQFSNVPSGSEYAINDLPVGMYTLTIAIPEILFEQTYGVTINELGSVSGKRTFLDSKSRTVSYSVVGSNAYKVLVNGQKKDFTFEDTGEHTISIENLVGQTEIEISGVSDCQGKISDSFFVGDLFQVFPTITSSNVNFVSSNENLKVKVFSLDGRLVKEQQYGQHENSMDMSSLKSGLYFVQMEMGDQKETVKIIKR